MKYCTLCQRYIEPQKKFNWIFFLLTCWFGVGLIYLAYYLIFGKKKYCPICKNNKLIKESPEILEDK